MGLADRKYMSQVGGAGVTPVDRVHAEDRAFVPRDEDAQFTMCGIDLLHSVGSDIHTELRDRVTCEDCLSALYGDPPAQGGARV